MKSISKPMELEVLEKELRTLEIELEAKKVEKEEKEKFGGTFQAVPFYQKSVNKKDLGNYFGAFNQNLNYNVVQDFIGVGYSSNELLLTPAQIIHNPGLEVAVADSINAKVKMEPTQESYGIRLDYHQKLDKLVKGLYFKVNLPVVYVKNDMGLSYTGNALTQQIPDGAGTGAVKSVLDYLSGNITTTMQDPLTHAKIDGSQSEIGVADIQVAVGYTLFNEVDKCLTGFVQATIPTSNKPMGEYLFEPIYGNARHWALGGGLDGRFEIWKDDDMSLDILFAAQYKYLFKATEKRTLGLLRSGNLINFGHYLLGGQINQTKVFPLANVLTRDVYVVPGGQFDGIAGLVFNWGNFTIDLGYNFFAKEKEEVEVSVWTEGLYAVTKSTYDPSSVFVSSDIDSRDSWITKERLAVSPVESPAQSSHKIFTALGYEFDGWNYPIMLGLGGSYEFIRGRNVGLEGYAFWAKAGLTF